ncbi:hypothetical protein [Chryseolinea lacunae]|uniref:Uncharacterized protein n=1 Tax=Chryseolinea lacunae TaxID=2801331 RepID=A0ABS1KLH3_9BACT|nr:hypothetical protein [Chryseolinea lacunae]MBL0740082.1 hypothetical protein [Chryseolinea lacunae]
MKRLLPVLTLLLTLGACTVYDVEPRYDSRTKLVGKYEMEEYSDTYNDLSYYSIYITKSAYAGEIYIDNFYASDILVRALVQNDRITIPPQVVNGFEVEGSGSIYGGNVSLTYRVRDRYENTAADFCNSTARPY